VWPIIESMLKQKGLRFEYLITEAPGHAIELAESAASNGYDILLSVGGDGTLHEVVNGVYSAGRISNLPLGIIGTGTGSDYIRSVGISHHYQQACERVFNHEKMMLDIGLVEYMKNGQPRSKIFVNFAGLGFDAEVVKATTQRFKRLGSKMSYLAGLLSNFVLYRNKSVSLAVDGEAINNKMCTVLVSNGKYGGGSMMVAPQADLKDGLLDVIMINNISKPDLLLSLPRIYKGTHLTHPKVTTRKAREIRVETKQTAAVQADGELLGETPARFNILPGAMTLIV
jgi:YegS/Rv2252/BmrU family lipid kinase